jgi:hypothetical protein
LIILAALLQGPAHAGTVYWNANTASPTSSTDIPGTITVGDVTRGNNNGVTPLTDSVSASSGYTFLLNGTSTSASAGNNFAAAAYLESINFKKKAYIIGEVRFVAASDVFLHTHSLIHTISR